MFQRLHSVCYQASNLGEAKEWYCRILDAEPIFDTPFMVTFSVGEAKLSLIPREDTHVGGGGPPVAYWEVDDIEAACRRLRQYGAVSHTEITTGFDKRWTTVADPFGNLLGLTGPIPDTKNRDVEHQPSETALGVATLRAFAAREEREEIRGADYLAEIFLPAERSGILDNPAGRAWVIKNHLPPGVYEYQLVRTVYFDQVMEQALRSNIPQIVFLGAGYDSRPYRFQALIKETQIFELDIHTTQQRKRELLAKANVSIPAQLTYVPVNFTNDTLREVLHKAGYLEGRRTLFIWEGVTYYLPAEVIDDTLRFIKLHSSVGSTVCFDYNALSPEAAEAFGVKELKEFMSSQSPAEPIKFGIEEGKTVAFLAERGFKILDHLTAEEMEKKYLTLLDGSLAGKVPALHCLVHAEVVE